MKNHHYSERFQQCVDHVLENEGGYVNDPRDPGGETNYGISKRAFPHLNIAALTRADAVKIYHDHYWNDIKGDQIISNELAMQVFDMAVNAGTVTAAKLVQEIVGTDQDGAIGRITLAAMDKYPSVAGMIERYKFLRARHYCRIVARRPESVRFLSGWINRIDS